jgi:FkbM family methyltransferase
MKRLSAVRYYITSIITLLTHFERPFQILSIFLKRPGSLPAEIQLKQGGLRFAVREPMDVWVIKETCVDADYLPAKDFQADWHVVDIGAGLGDFTVFAASLCSSGRVFAYEPLASSYGFSEHNLALNNLSNVETFQQATASAAGTMKPQTEPTEAVSTRFVSGTAASSESQTAIPIITLAEILDRVPDRHCHLMKIDCEGCEFDLLLNSPPELLARIDRLTIETHDGYTGQTAEQLAAYLRQQGFTVRQESNPVHDYLGFIFAERIT